MDFWQLIEVLGKRKWLIFLSAIAAVILTFGITMVVGQKWQATVQFIAPTTPDANNAVAVDENNNDGENPADPAADPGATEAAVYEAIIKSRDVLQPVLTKMTDPPQINKLLPDLAFQPAGPHLYELRVQDTNVRRSWLLANALAAQFVIVERQVRTKQISDAVSFLTAQLHDNDTKLAVAQARYQDYRNQHQIVGTAGAQINNYINDLQTAIRAKDTIVGQMSADQAQLDVANSQIAQVPKLNPLDAAGASPVLNSQLMQQEQQKEALADLLKTHKPNHPAVIAAQKQLDDLTKRIDSEFQALQHSDRMNPELGNVQAQIRTLNYNIAGLQANLNSINNQIAAAQNNISRLNGTDTTVQTLLERVTELQDSRNSLVARLNTAQMALDAARRQDPIVVLNRVSAFNPPINTTKGRNMKLLVLAALCALLCSSAIVVALHSIDKRVKNVRDAEIALPARLLASIPQPLPATSYANIARITEMQPQSLHSEAYRFLGLHLLNTGKPQVRSLMVLAAKAEQGSTTTLTNLGITLAQAGKRVILVDANIRTSEIHTVFGVDNDFGFTNLLESPDPESLAKALRPTANENLHFITSGPVPKNAWQLFRSQNLMELSCRLHDLADYVLYDTPSSLMFTDALNLSPVVDAAILCVRALEPLTGTEERLIELLERANVTVLGSVLSDVPTEVLEGFENYEHYYKPLEAPTYPYDDGEGGNGVRQAVVVAEDEVLPAGKTAIITPSPLRSNKNGRNGGPAKN
jgi:capsular exopolysaccharide synthesis family protein